MKLLTYFINFFLLSLTLSTYASDADFMKAYTQHKQKKTKANLLFVQPVKKVTLVSVSSDCYQVNLAGLEPQLLYFTVHPLRQTSEFTNKTFVKIWLQDKITPNAVLRGHLVDNHDSPVKNEVLTLSNPSYDVQKNEINFKACVVDSKNNMPTKTKIYYNAVIFYDPYCLGCQP